MATTKKKTANGQRGKSNVKTNALVRREPPSVAEAIEKVLIGGDLAPLKVEERIDYYKKVCQSLGLNPLTRPFDYSVFDGRSGEVPRGSIQHRSQGRRKLPDSEDGDGVLFEEV
jgi:hypothetical protein